MNPLLKEQLTEILRQELREPRTLGHVLADAFQLDATDRLVVEKFMCAARTQGLLMDIESLRECDAATLRCMWGLSSN